MTIQANPADNSSSTTPDGLYYSPRLPFLSCIAAVCCGLKSERDLFSNAAYGTFCRNRYGLSDYQTKVLTAAAHNQPPPGKKCIPTPEQLEEIVKVLEKELESAQVPDTRIPPKAGFDPAFDNVYPAVVELYRSYVLGELPKPSDAWHSDLRAQLTAQNSYDRQPPAVW